MNELLIIICCIMALALYFVLAKRLKLVDKPNERSSHQRPTYRGAGIVFLVAYLASLIFLGPSPLYLTLGLILAAFVGFWDDFKGLPAAPRAILYLTALFLCLIAIKGFINIPLLYFILTLILGLGTVNAYNFMDGINGITVIYSLVLLLSIAILGRVNGVDVPEHLIIALILGSLVFSFLNFRKNALAFMGDTGSVFLGMAAVYLVVNLIWETHEPAWLLLLLVYGVDSVLTISERLMRRENIFKAHRRHLYQVLVNEYRFSHIGVAVIYGLVQLLFNLLLWLAIDSDMPSSMILLLFSGSAGIIYLLVKIRLLRPLPNS